ncbi:MAG: hypothetical protein LBT00_16480 [Spirochaetaceae bacterium]|nr:hypothetical protein [Spirochaetaceae bacterium]
MENVVFWKRRVPFLSFSIIHLSFSIRAKRARITSLAMTRGELSLRDAKRRSNPDEEGIHAGLLRSARNDGKRTASGRVVCEVCGYLKTLSHKR